MPVALEIGNTGTCHYPVHAQWLLVGIHSHVGEHSAERKGDRSLAPGRMDEVAVDRSPKCSRQSCLEKGLV